MNTNFKKLTIQTQGRYLDNLSFDYKFFYKITRKEQKSMLYTEWFLKEDVTEQQ